MNTDKLMLLLLLGGPVSFAAYWYSRQIYVTKMQILGRSIVVSLIATIVVSIANWGLVSYDEYRACGDWSCEKLDGPSAGGLLMMDFAVMVCSAVVLVGSLSAGIIIGALKYYIKRARSGEKL